MTGKTVLPLLFVFVLAHPPAALTSVSVRAFRFFGSFVCGFVASFLDSISADLGTLAQVGKCLAGGRAVVFQC